MISSNRSDFTTTLAHVVCNIIALLSMLMVLSACTLSFSNDEPVEFLTISEVEADTKYSQIIAERTHACGLGRDGTYTIGNNLETSLNIQLGISGLLSGESGVEIANVTAGIESHFATEIGITKTTYVELSFPVMQDHVLYFDTVTQTTLFTGTLTVRQPPFILSNVPFSVIERVQPVVEGNFTTIPCDEDTGSRPTQPESTLASEVRIMPVINDSVPIPMIQVHRASDAMLITIPYNPTNLVLVDATNAVHFFNDDFNIGNRDESLADLCVLYTQGDSVQAFTSEITAQCPNGVRELNVETSFWNNHIYFARGTVASFEFRYLGNCEPELTECDIPTN